MIMIKLIVSDCMPRIISSGTKKQRTVYIRPVLQASGLGCGAEGKAIWFLEVLTIIEKINPRQLGR